MVTDLDAELGEGFGRWRLTDDEVLLAAVSSTNIACGFHAGDPSTMRRVCAAAAEREAAVGAQVPYRGPAGLGWRAMDAPAGELADEVAYRIGALRVFAEAAGARVVYVKPHGALCGRMVRDEEQARAVVARVLPVAAGEAGPEAVGEAFADRAYASDGDGWCRGGSRAPCWRTPTRW